MSSWESLSSITILGVSVPQVVMLIIAVLLAYIAITKKYEPLLLLPLAFGMIIANVPFSGLSAFDEGGLIYYLYKGIKMGIYPPLIFLCIGTMTDFSSLLASPIVSALIGLGGQLGIFVAAACAYLLGKVMPNVFSFSIKDAISIGMIGSASGPTTIYTASVLSPAFLSIITIAAYSYTSLVPVIQPPIMKALTNDKERTAVMPPPKRVNRTEKIAFSIIVTILALYFVPQAGSLIAMLMLGNLIKESGVTDRYINTLQNHLLNILTLLIGISVGATATADKILNLNTLIIIILGLIAFVFGTIGGVLMAKLLYKITKGRVNPLIGNAGVAAMPMAARVSQKMGQEYNPQNHLLMHSMGPVVAGKIISAVIAGIFISYFG